MLSAGSSSGHGGRILSYHRRQCSPFLTSRRAFSQPRRPRMRGIRKMVSPRFGTPSSAASFAPACAPIAPRSGKPDAARTWTRPIGRVLSRASEIRAPACSSWVLHPAPTAQTAQAVLLRGMVPATSCTRSFTPSASLPARAPPHATTACSFATPGSPPSSVAPRPATSRRPRRSATVPNTSPRRSHTCRA